MEWSFQVFRRQAAMIPPIVPINAERMADTPTRATVAGIAATIHDVIAYYPDTGVDFWLVYGVAATVSGVVIAGIGGWLLLRALVRAGVLGDFAAGREQREL